MRTAAETAGAGAEQLIDIELAVVEAANNIVLHGYGSREGKIAAAFSAEGGRIEVVLEDRGAPIPPDRLAAEDSTGAQDISGRGLGIIAVCTSALHYSSRGGLNRLALVWLS